jgi:hypothetical protein
MQFLIRRLRIRFADLSTIAKRVTPGNGRVTLARKSATITWIIAKEGVRFDP